MNPLTWKATRDPRRERRQETVLCIGCGIVFGALCTMFLIKSFA